MQRLGLAEPNYLQQLQESVQWKLNQNSTPETFKRISRLDVKEQLPSLTTHQSLEVSMPDSQMNGLSDLTVDVNGVREELGVGQENDFRIRLLPGKNRIVIAGQKEGCRCVLVHDIYCKRNAEKDRTWFVGLGVSKYQKESMNLDFASKDVSDLADELEHLAGGDFKRLLLRDQEATREEVLKSVAEFVQQASPRDSLIVALAGHGFVQSGSYHFALNDCNFDSTDTGTLSLLDIERLISRSPARRRVVMLDTCHSGSELPGARPATSQGGSIRFKGRSLGVASSTTNSRQDQIRKHMLEQFGNQIGMSGTTVISASNAGQFALESAEWNNGAFTFAVRQAMRSKEADTNSDGKISVSELAVYVEDFVTELTGGKQRPEARFLNSALDTHLIEAKKIKELAIRFNKPKKDAHSPNCLAVCPAGKYLALAVKNQVQVMNLETGKIETWESESDETIHKLRFTKNSECLIAWQYHGQIWATSLQTRKLTNISPEGSSLSAFVLSEDLSLAVSLDSFSSEFTRFQFSAQGIESKTVNIDEVRRVSSHTILPGNRNLRVLVDGAVKDFDLHTGKSKLLREVDLDETVFGDQISFFDSGKWLVKTGIQDENSGPNLTWLNVATGDVKKLKSARPLFGFRVAGKSMPLHQLGEFPGRKQARYRFLFDADSQATVDTQSLDINADEEFRLSNDNRHVAVFRKSTAYDSPDRGIRVYSLSTGKEVAWLNSPDDDHFELAFDEENRKLYAVDSDWRVWFWKLNPLQETE